MFYNSNTHYLLRLLFYLNSCLYTCTFGENLRFPLTKRNTERETTHRLYADATRINSDRGWRDCCCLYAGFGGALYAACLEECSVLCVCA